MEWTKSAHLSKSHEILVAIKLGDRHIRTVMQVRSRAVDCEPVGSVSASGHFGAAALPCTESNWSKIGLMQGQALRMRLYVCMVMFRHMQGMWVAYARTCHAELERSAKDEPTHVLKGKR